MQFKIQGHSFNLEQTQYGPQLSLIEWPSGTHTARLIQGSPRSLDHAKRIATNLLKQHAQNPDLYQIPPAERIHYRATNIVNLAVQQQLPTSPRTTDQIPSCSDQTLRLHSTANP